MSVAVQWVCQLTLGFINYKKGGGNQVGVSRQEEIQHRCHHSCNPTLGLRCKRWRSHSLVRNINANMSTVCVQRYSRHKYIIVYEDVLCFNVCRICTGVGDLMSLRFVMSFILMPSYQFGWCCFHSNELLCSCCSCHESVYILPAHVCDTAWEMVNLSPVAMSRLGPSGAVFHYPTCICMCNPGSELDL